MVEEKIENSIALHQATINDLQEIKERIEKSDTNDIRFKIETEHWYGFSAPFIAKKKHKIKISKYSAKVLLETAIKIEKERIDKLIDKLIENRKKVEDK